jgi:hypothetical protein
MSGMLHAANAQGFGREFERTFPVPDTSLCAGRDIALA